MITISSDADTTSDERYKQIKKVITEPDGAKKLARRYGNAKLILLELKKEKEGVYYLKEELKKEKGNIQREYAYKQKYHYADFQGKMSIWSFEKWRSYLKNQGKKEQDVYGATANNNEFYPT